MELVKAIINLIISYFQNKTANVTKEVKLADTETKAVVATIRANENATAVQEIQETQKEVQELIVKQEKDRKIERKKPLKKRIDDQFGSDQ